MARLTFPDEGSRMVFRTAASGRPLTSAAGASAVVYTDATATTLADIETTAGAAISGSSLNADAYSRLPLFLGPADGTDTLYVVVDGGPVSPMYARADDRIDAVKATADAAETPTAAQAKATAAQAAAIAAAATDAASRVSAEATTRAGADSAEATARASAVTAAIATAASDATTKANAAVVTAGTNAAGAYASKLRETARRIPKPNTVLPPEMTVPPTFALSGPGGASPINGGSPTVIPYNTTAVKRQGCVPALITQFSTDYHYNAVSNWTPPPWWVVTDHFGTDLALRFRARSGGADDCKVWVWVDGEPATPAPVGLGTLSSGSLYRYRITFSGATSRRVAIWMDSMDFGGLDIAPTAAVSYPTTRLEKLAVYGDSWVEGANSVQNVDLWAEQLPWYMGMEGFRCGQGGTGYVGSPGGGKTPYTDTTRLDLLAQTGADYVLVYGTTNDDGQSGIQAAAATTYAGIASRLPNAKIIVAGVWGTSASGANRATNRDAVKAAALAATNVIGFIDVYADAWLNGTGKVGATAGDGVDDLILANDGLHLYDADAHAYFRTRMQAAVSTLLAA